MLFLLYIKYMIIFLNEFYKSLFFIFLLYLYFFKNSVYSNFIRDTEIENIINSWSHPIFKAAGIPENTIDIHLVADNEINAFVTDGKNMFLNTGLVIKAGSASGLIGVIAHETGHIAAGHIVKLKQTIRKLEDNQFITSLLGMGILVLGTTNDNFKNDRVDIAKLDIDDLSGDSLTGGYIIKVDKWNGENNNGW